MSRSRSNGKSKPPTKSFAGIPRIVMETDDYRNLNGNAIKLLNALAYQYRGNNNGDLQATFSEMKNWGFKSKETLTNALKALLKAHLIEKTREGMFMNPGGKCALYALTWCKRDECQGKHDMKATVTPIRKFSLEKQKARPENFTKVAPKIVPTNSKEAAICY